jgi:hypothetical protein
VKPGCLVLEPSKTYSRNSAKIISFCTVSYGQCTMFTERAQISGQERTVVIVFDGKDSLVIRINAHYTS